MYIRCLLSPFDVLYKIPGFFLETGVLITLFGNPHLVCERPVGNYEVINIVSVSFQEKAVLKL